MYIVGVLQERMISQSIVFMYFWQRNCCFLHSYREMHKYENILHDSLVVILSLKLIDFSKLHLVYCRAIPLSLRTQITIHIYHLRNSAAQATIALCPCRARYRLSSPHQPWQARTRRDRRSLPNRRFLASTRWTLPYSCRCWSPGNS